MKSLFTNLTISEEASLSGGEQIIAGDGYSVASDGEVSAGVGGETGVIINLGFWQLGNQANQLLDLKIYL